MTNKQFDMARIPQTIWTKGLLIGLAAFMLFLVTTGISEASNYLAEQIYPHWQSMDPDGSYLYISLHHVFQAVLALILIALIKIRLNKSWSDFGFNVHEWRFSLKRVLQFCAFWFVLQGSIAVIMMLTGSSPAPFHFPLTTGNFAGYFLFQVLLSGTSEEILFRALVIITMLYVGKRAGYSDKANTIIAVVVSILIFMLGHVNIRFNPFRVDNFNLLQQVTVITFGGFYAYLFLKTKSLLGPMLAHNWLNGVIVLIGLLVNLVFG
jgi:membrane protease YdiL (CAAX protease family)